MHWLYRYSVEVKKERYIGFQALNIFQQRKSLQFLGRRNELKVISYVDAKVHKLRQAKISVIYRQRRSSYFLKSFNSFLGKSCSICVILAVRSYFYIYVVHSHWLHHDISIPVRWAPGTSYNGNCKIESFFAKIDNPSPKKR